MKLLLQMQMLGEDEAVVQMRMTTRNKQNH
jgi:hypothetical protein